MQLSPNNFQTVSRDQVLVFFNRQSLLESEGGGGGG